MTQKSDLTIDILFDAPQWREIADLEPLIRRTATTAYEKAREIRGIIGAHELSINLSDDAVITDLNQRYRDKNKPTNVLSFPFEDEFPDLFPGPKPLGDIILAHETMSREAHEQNIPIDHHIAHLVVHGVLHLFGYDHIDLPEAVEMEKLECELLATQHIPSPYRDR